jgi:hypothetical protein
VGGQRAAATLRRLQAASHRPRSDDAETDEPGPEEEERTRLGHCRVHRPGLSIQADDVSNKDDALNIREGEIGDVALAT